MKRVLLMGIGGVMMLGLVGMTGVQFVPTVNASQAKCCQTHEGCCPSSSCCKGGSHTMNGHCAMHRHA